MSARHDAANVCDLIKRFCEENDIKEPREGWDRNYINPPPREDTTTALATERVIEAVGEWAGDYPIYDSCGAYIQDLRSLLATYKEEE